MQCRWTALLPYRYLRAPRPEITSPLFDTDDKEYP